MAVRLSDIPETTTKGIRLSDAPLFPTGADPDKPLGFVPDIIPPTGIPEIADPKDVGLPRAPVMPMKPLAEVLVHGYKGAGNLMVDWLSNIAQQESEVGGKVRTWVWNKLGMEKPNYLKKMDETLGNWGREMQGALQQYIKEHPEEQKRIPEDAGFWETLGTYVTRPDVLGQALIENSPLMMLGGAGHAIAGAPASIILMGLPLSADVYADARKEGTKILPAFMQSILGGYGEAAIEEWTLGKKIGLAKSISKIKGLPRMLWEGTKLFFRGMAEEGSQRFNRNLWNWVFTDRSQKLFQDVMVEAAAGGPMELAMGGVFAAAGKSIQMVPARERVNRVKQFQEAVDRSDLSEQEKEEITAELNKAKEYAVTGGYPEEAPMRLDEVPVFPVEKLIEEAPPPALEKEVVFETERPVVAETEPTPPEVPLPAETAFKEAVPPTEEALPEKVTPKLYIGNVTQRMKQVFGEIFGVPPTEVKPFTEAGFPTKRAGIEVTREQAQEALEILTEDLNRQFAENRINTENELALANAHWGDIVQLREVLGLPKIARPFKVIRAKKHLVKVFAKVKERIEKAVQPSKMFESGMTVQQVLQATMKKAEVASAKAWLESAKETVETHKNLAKYIVEELQGVKVTEAERKRFLAFVGRGRTPIQQAHIIAAVDMLAEKARVRQANNRLKLAIADVRSKAGKTIQKGGLWENAQEKLENLFDAIVTKKITDKALNSARSLHDYLEKVKTYAENEFDAEYAESLIPSRRLKLLADITRDQTRLLTSQGIEAITQEIEHIVNLNNVKSKWYIFGKENRSRDLVKNTRDEILAGRLRRATLKEADKYITKRGTLKQAKDITIGVDNSDMYTLAKKITGKEGLLTNVTDTKIRQATNKVYEVMQRAMILFNEKIVEAGITSKDLKKMSSEYDTWTPTELLKRVLVPKVRINIKGKKIELTQGQLIDIYLYTKQKLSRDYLLKNVQNYFNNIDVGRLTTQELSKTLDYLTPKAEKVAETMSEVLNTYVKDELAKAQKSLDGINIFTVLDFWHIEHPGEAKIPGSQGYIVDFIENQDILMPRVGSKKGIVNRDAFVRFRKVLAGSAEYIGYAEPLRNLRMVLNNPAIIDAIKKQGYNNELRAMQTIIKRAQSFPQQIDSLSSLSSRLLRGFIRSALGIRLDIGAMQAGSTALYPNFIEAKYVNPLRGNIRPYFTRGELREALQHSPFLWARWTLGHQSMEVGYLAETDATVRLFMGKSHKLNWTMKHLQVGDMVAMINGWRLAKDKIGDTTKLEKGSPEYWKAVNEEANYLWYRTQPIYDKFGRSVNTSTPGLARHAFIFRSFRQKALQNIQNKGKFDNRTRAAATVLVCLAIGEITKALIRWPLFREEPDEKSLAKKLITAPLSLLAVIGYPAQTIVSNMIDRALGDRPKWSEVDVSLPVFEMVNRALQSINYYSQAIGFYLSGDKEKAEEYGLRALRNLIEALGTYYGAPVSFIRGVTKKKEEETSLTPKKPIFKKSTPVSKKPVFKKPIFKKGAGGQ